VINQLVSRWPSCKIVNGRPRHQQSQGSVERSNQDVENMLRAWLKDNNSTNWSLGNYFVQWQKKSSCHRIIKRTPYKALFGVDFPVGLFSTDLPTETFREITTEEDLEEVLTNITEGEEVYFEHLITNSSQISQETNHSGDEEVFELNDTPTAPKNSTDIEEIQIFNVVDIPIVDQTIVEIDSNASNKTVHCEKCLKNLT
jgi:hypothetical protein